MSTTQFIILLVLTGIILIVSLIIVFVQTKKSSNEKFQLEQLNILLKQNLDQTKKDLDESFFKSVRDLGGLFQDSQDKISKSQFEKLDVVQKNIAESMSREYVARQEFNQNMLLQQKELKEEVTKTLFNTNTQTEQKLENIRKTVADSISKLQEENSKKLDQMRDVVDEKLQKTLEDRISKSFSSVSERLEEVHKGLGEMKTIASGVGDLKRVLSNVKTRGTLGEIQLQNIIEEIMTREQYEVNFPTKKGSSNRVEFAIKLPGEGPDSVYLPIDAKFPLDPYHKLLDAFDSGDAIQIEASQKELVAALKKSAKDISEKYIDVPNTTEFAIMFLPIEGLFAEAVKLDLIGILQREYHVNIAGPTTLVALLNSLQMGFRTLAIQEKSQEVWKTLEAVKTEFSKFGNVLNKAQDQINKANQQLDKLVGTRTRAIQRKLRKVGQLDRNESKSILDIEDLEEIE